MQNDVSSHADGLHSCMYCDVNPLLWTPQVRAGSGVGMGVGVGSSFLNLGRWGVGMAWMERRVVGCRPRQGSGQRPPRPSSGARPVRPHSCCNRATELWADRAAESCCCHCCHADVCMLGTRAARGCQRRHVYSHVVAIAHPYQAIELHAPPPCTPPHPAGRRRQLQQGRNGHRFPGAGNPVG